MKPTKILPAVVIALTVPTVAYAQIVIERYNTKSDPTAIVVDTGTNGAESETEVEELPSFDESELSDIRKALKSPLKDAIAKCLSGASIMRPEIAKVSGTATYNVDENGNAKFQDGKAEINSDVFYIDGKQRKVLEPEKQKEVETKGNAAFTACVQGGSAKVDIEGKSGDVSVSYSASVSKGKVKISISN